MKTNLQYSDKYLLNCAILIDPEYWDDRMKTASFFTYFGPGRIAIVRGRVPVRTPKGYRIYRDLAPRWDMLTMPYDQYRTIYFSEILGLLDPAKVLEALERLADGHEPVLLCFERPPFSASNWCHRRMVADWFAESLQLEVPEIKLEP
jgi:uncharacterized protein (DUF488 family)